MLKKIIHYSFVLTLICALSIFGVSFVYSLTFHTIELKELAKKEAALSSVLKDMKIDTNSAKFVYKNDGESKEYEIYTGRDPQTNEIKAWAIQIGEQGYSSVIQTMIGANDKDEITAIEVVFQQETPGLGTECISTGPKKLSSLWSGEKIEIKRPWFQAQYSGKKSNELKLKEGIKVISGATITSSAVNRAVSKALQILKAFKEKK